MSKKYKLSSIKNDDKCNQCILENNNCDTRNEIISNCIPLIYLSGSNINILNYDKLEYIYYNNDQLETYFIDKDFKFNKYEGSKILHKENQIKELLNYLDKSINLPKLNNIPLYYLFINTDNIFNLFICQYKILIETKEKAILQLNNEITLLDKTLDEKNKTINNAKRLLYLKNKNDEKDKQLIIDIEQELNKKLINSNIINETITELKNDNKNTTKEKQKKIK